MIDALGLRRLHGGRRYVPSPVSLVRHIVAVLGRRREHRSLPHWKNARRSFANGLTAGRAVIAATILGLAIYEGSHWLLVLGLLASWTADMVDGHVARARGCETVLGAQLDGLADRLTAMLVIAGSIRIAGDSALAVICGIAVWLQFGMLDYAVSAQFLRYGRWSPDEMHLDDEDAWRMNWAPLAKVMSNVPVGLLALGGMAMWGALGGAVVLLLVRASGSLRLLAGLSARANEEPRPRSLSPAISQANPPNEAEAFRESPHQAGFSASLSSW